MSGRIATSRLGRLPEVTAIAAIGFLFVALGFAEASAGKTNGELLFWLGLVSLTAPIGYRLAGAGASRAERICLIIVLAVGLYLVKVAHSPIGFTFPDEFAQWRNVEDVLSTGHLFASNPLLPVTTFYPGLQSVTSAVSETAGIAPFFAGLLVLGSARLVLALALYLFLEISTSSPRIAGLAVFVYTANPNFVYFGAQAAYESLALPLAIFALYLVLRRQRAASGAGHAGLTVCAALVIGATVITHHLTSLALAAFLIGWTLVDRVRVPRTTKSVHPTGLAAFALVSAAAWSLFVASQTVRYLTPVLSGAITEFVRLLAGEGSGRVLFRFGTGAVAPAWEQLTAFAAVGLILLGIPLGILVVVRRKLSRPVVVTMALAALTYPGALGLRLTVAGAETSNRSSEFLFVAVAPLVGAALLWWLVSPRAPVRRLLPTVAAMEVIFIGGLILGWPSWARLPGPYLVGADSRSIEREGILAAQWARDHLGPDNRFVSDRTNRFLLGTYGGQRPVTGYADLVDAKSLIFRQRLTVDEQRIARQGQVRYVLIDRRLATALPQTGIYVERGELTVLGQHREPISPSRLAKYDGVPGISRIMDSGDIQIYDISGWTAEH
jgi:hypothetical protein